MALNVTIVKFRKGNTTALSSPLFQYDYGQIIKIEGLDLPDAYEVHFDNVIDGEEAIPQIGDADGVVVPDVLLLEPDTIYAWIFLHEGEDDGETKYVITIPVKARSKATQVIPDPVEQDVITQTIAALNTAVNKANIAIKHYPYIADTGTWFVWDVENEEYVDTGINATGPQGERGIQGETGETGNGIDNVVLNQDYSLTITYTNGDSYTTAPIKGDKGDKGDTGETGNGIDNVVLNQDYTLTIHYTDGTSFTTTPIRGAKGDKGDTGDGITNITFNQDYSLTITLSNGDTYTTGSIRGERGEQGTKGDPGIKGEDGKDGSIISFNNGVMVITDGGE